MSAEAKGNRVESDGNAKPMSIRKAFRIVAVWGLLLIAFGIGTRDASAAFSSISADHDAACHCGRQCKGTSCCCGRASPRLSTLKPSASKVSARTLANPILGRNRPTAIDASLPSCLGTLPCGDPSLPASRVFDPASKVVPIAERLGPIVVEPQRLFETDPRLQHLGRHEDRLDDPPEPL